MQTGETTRYTFAPLSRAEAIKMKPVSQIHQVSTVVRGTPVCQSDPPIAKRRVKDSYRRKEGNAETPKGAVPFI